MRGGSVGGGVVGGCPRRRLVRVRGGGGGAVGAVAADEVVGVAEGADFELGVESQVGAVYGGQGLQAVDPHHFPVEGQGVELGVVGLGCLINETAEEKTVTEPGARDVPFTYRITYHVITFY